MTTKQQLNNATESAERQQNRIQKREQRIVVMLVEKGRAAAHEFHETNHARDKGLTFDALLSLSKRGEIAYQRKQINSYWQLTVAQCHH